MRILVLEPYYGGSHKAFLDDLARLLPISFDLLTLPARKWKWRMRLAAPFFADRLKEMAEKQALKEYSALFCSAFVDVAALRALAPIRAGRLPIRTYFHENQFAYPVQAEEERDFHFALTNYTTALASDRLAFNSRYNLDSFLAGCGALLKKAPDMKLVDREGQLRAKSTILPPGLDFSAIDQESAVREKVRPPVIVWNHRWEHDKNPGLFFETLYELDRRRIPFRLIVMGEAFERRPAVFAEARQRLGKRLVHFGYAPSRAQYIRLLKQGDIVVSTAFHEFYGIAVLEAVRAGCRPVLPKRLSYPELFPHEFLYEDGDLLESLLAALSLGRLSEARSRELTQAFSWNSLLGRYQSWFSC